MDDVRTNVRTCHDDWTDSLVRSRGCGKTIFYPFVVENDTTRVERGFGRGVKSRVDGWMDGWMHENEWMRDSRDVDAREGAKERTKARGMSTAAARALAAVVDAGRDGAYRDRGWERERRGLDAWMHACMHA